MKFIKHCYGTAVHPSRCFITTTTTQAKGTKQRHIIPFLHVKNFSTKSSSASQDTNFCVDVVRTRDRDGYLCGLLQPSGKSRDAYFAIRAFNVEIASIKDAQKSRSAGSLQASQLKLQWWREAVEDMFVKDESSSMEQNDGMRGFGVGGDGIQNPAALHQPVVRALGRAAKDWNFTRRFLEKMVDARERDLEVDQLDTLDDLIRYGADTWACLMYLSLESVGVSKCISLFNLQTAAMSMKEYVCSREIA